MCRRQNAEKSEILTSFPYKNLFTENKAANINPAVVQMQQLKGKKTNGPTKIKMIKKLTAMLRQYRIPTILKKSKSATENATNCFTC